MLYRAEYAIHVRFHTSFRDQKGKYISSSFALEEKNRSFILGGYIEGNYGIYFWSRITRTSVFILFLGLAYKTLSLNFVHRN